MKISFILPIILTTYVSALGINCRGSSNCGGSDCKIHELQRVFDEVPDSRMIAPGEKIACCLQHKPVGGFICAFTQDTHRSISGREAKQLFKGIVEHKCRKCGSNPFQDNDVKKGQLTVNYVWGLSTRA